MGQNGESPSGGACWTGCARWKRALNGNSLLWRTITPERFATAEPSADAGNGQPAERADVSPKTKKPKRSTARGEGRAKLVAALTLHHKYADGGCLNLEPIVSNELARQAKVVPSTASGFFNKVFNGGEKEGYARYRVYCRDAGRLADSLKALNGEFSPHDLYGRKPAGEDEPDEE